MRVKKMSIDRRDFLKFVIGGAVGTVISPLPWVSMDEVAKWTQRWAPLPDKGGAVSFIHSTCKLCPGGCGIRVRLIEEKRAVKIDGNPDHPVNRGGLCPLGLAGLQYLYLDQNRVKAPMKRTGMRGGGDWKPVSWDEALSELSGRLKELRQKNLSHTVAFLNGEGDGTQAFLAGRFLKAYGSPNYIRPYHPRELEEIITQNMHGLRSRINYDLPRSDYVLSFGCALLDGWGNPCWTAQAFEAWRQEDRKDRPKVVQIDTMATPTASLADEWVAVKPGQEAFLALGLAQAILENGWFVKGLPGLDEIRTYLKKYFPWDRVTQETGIEQGTIQRIAREFSSARQPVALWGKGKGDLPGSLFQAQAVHLLNILTGSINRPGGAFLQSGFSFNSWPQTPLDETAGKGLSQSRTDEAFSSKYPKTGNLEFRFFTNIAQNKLYPINALFLNETNPVFSLDESIIRQALDRIPLVVSFSSFMDETSALVDWILPAPTFLERWDDSTYSVGVPFPVYGLTKPVLPPLYDTRSMGDTLIQLAKKIGGTVEQALPIENMQGAIKQTAKGLYDSKKGRLSGGPATQAEKNPSGSLDSFDKFWEQLIAQGAWYGEDIKGESGKTFNFVSMLQEPVRLTEKPVNTSFPLWLIPQSLLLLQSGYWANPPFLTKLLGEETLKHKDLVVQIHPRTAKKLSLFEADRVELRSRKGKLMARVHLFEGATPDCVFAPLGLGHQAFDPTLKGKGANLYPLLDTQEDPITGLLTAGVTPVSIKKI
jgi:anaerobic selenocysteine-containing dehydrogenase